MQQKLLNIGFGNHIVADAVVAIISPNSAPAKRMKNEAAEAGRLIDATQGRKTRSVIVMSSNHVVLSAINPDTISLRFATLNGQGLTAQE
jgi:hypothetical protein